MPLVYPATHAGDHLSLGGRQLQAAGRRSLRSQRHSVPRAGAVHQEPPAVCAQLLQNQNQGLADRV